MALPLEGRVALVTGGSRGIGAAIARRLAAGGAAVALTSATSEARAHHIVDVIESAGGRALALAADSADPGAIREAVESTARKLGRLDILVNNAGIAPMAPLDRFSPRARIARHRSTTRATGAPTCRP